MHSASAARIHIYHDNFKSAVTGNLKTLCKTWNLQIAHMCMNPAFKATIFQGTYKNFILIFMQQIAIYNITTSFNCWRRCWGAMIAGRKRKTPLTKVSSILSCIHLLNYVASPSLKIPYMRIEKLVVHYKSINLEIEDYNQNQVADCITS